MPFKPYREGSRTNWGVTTDSNLTVEQINCGAILRIADATELMAKNHAQLVAERDRFERWYQHEKTQLSSERRRTAALRGIVKKLKAQRSAGRETK